MKGVAAVPKKDITNLAAACEKTEWGSAVAELIEKFAKEYGFELQEIHALRRQGHRPFQRGALPDRREARCHAVRLLRVGLPFS